MRHSQLLLACVLALHAPLCGQLVTVTTAADVIDVDPATATVADLPGPDGRVSFSEAMIATNNTPGHQTVGFAIPRSEWILQFALPGRAVLTSTVGYYFRAFDAVTIDGTTQTAFTGDTNPDGAEVAFYGVELYLVADGCTLTSIDSSAVTFSGRQGLATGNTGTMNLTLFQGGGSRVEGNRCGTIKIDRSNDNVVIGNVAQRVRVLGFGPAAPARGNRIGGPLVAERNHLTGYGTYNSEGLPAGATIQLFATSDTLIENNWIGTSVDGMAQGNTAATMGISFEGSNVGTVVRDNLIAGILGQGRGPHHAGQLFGWAIYMTGTGSDVDIVGNTIGLDASGNPSLGSVWGIDVGYAGRGTFTDVRIGGPSAGDGNVVAGHRFVGVVVGNTCTDIRLQGNSISANGGLGIDLVTDAWVLGPTPNDPLDADSGGNGLQNHPVLDRARTDGAWAELGGSLHSTPGRTFTIELFSSPTCDPSGFGEAARPLGTTQVTTDAAGNATFQLTVAATVPVGHVATATAIAEPGGATSELSACLPFAGWVCQLDLGAQGPGSAIASLCGDGLRAGQRSRFAVQGAPSGAAGAALVSVDGRPDVALLGGTLVSFTGFVAPLSMTADGSGRAGLAVDGLGPPTFDLVFQAVFLDAATPHGVAFTNAVRARFGR
ncbi:MAG: right-handed parallel beta-helix repeat-containing protein [Planctomycetes bacterium]|nr:right-handed parallel beta-helix repeat-containing protein [Planctomycetota bacterium]